MSGWDRQTPWRQGHIIPEEALVEIGLISPESLGESVAVVISHDCDLSQSPEVEPDVEIILGRRVESQSGNLTHAKNPRRLHLEGSSSDAPIFIELSAQSKHLIAKGRLVHHAPSQIVSFSAKELAILQRWLAARYRRSAFPDEFERRLTERGLDRRLAKIIEPLGTHLVAVFFDVDGNEDVAHTGSNDPYALCIDLLYSTAEDPEASEVAAQQAVASIKSLFRNRCLNKQGQWEDIELVDCSAISDEVMTYAMSTQVKKWNADHLSLRAESPQPITAE